ncbi:MAG: ABC transporter, ATP-binding protein [Ktedonobacterales bacterium]|jgi:ABC-2 type transport system ATP-binding protein|nr:MAG: ABC transporter, ATP-binding protein [Ktedonobacterales bacterium]
MSNALETAQLGRRYGRVWALQDCTLALPAGRIVALVGPNGAGKTTFLHLAVGLLRPTAGSVSVFGHSPQREPLTVLPRVGFVAQDHPLYKEFTVNDHLTLGRKLNRRWDEAYAVSRLNQFGIPLTRAAGKLSGGQQAQVALALGMAKRPELALLDEPLASLDPLARRDFLRALMDVAVADGLTVVLSSHLITDLERVCDYLVVLSHSRVALIGDIEEIVRTHKRLVGPRTDHTAVAAVHNVIEESHTARQTTLLVRVNGHIFDPAWEIADVTLEDIVLAYMGQARASVSEASGGGMGGPWRSPLDDEKHDEERDESEVTR